LNNNAWTLVHSKLEWQWSVWCLLPKSCEVTNYICYIKQRHYIQVNMVYNNDMVIQLFSTAYTNQWNFKCWRKLQFHAILVLHYFALYSVVTNYLKIANLEHTNTQARILSDIPTSLHLYIWIIYSKNLTNIYARNINLWALKCCFFTYTWC
jgi:hypothetical protein